MRKIDNLLFGTAGIPISTAKRNTLEGIKQVKHLGLDAMEIEFVQSVNISENLAKEVKQTAEQQKIMLTCHAPYYINLNSETEEKNKASMHRLLEAARRINQCGGWGVVFHPGFYMKTSAEKAYENVKKRLKEVVKTLKDENADVWIRPETTGRATAFGDLKEICKLSQDIENVLPCIDFAHMHARTGKNNTLEEFREMLTHVEKTLGKEALNNMHCHIAGINYSEKGERNHLDLEESDMNYKDLVKIWKEFKIKGIIVSESPNIEKDALLLKKEFRK